MKRLNPIVELILETKYVCNKILSEQAAQVGKRVAEVGLEMAAEQLAKLFGKEAEQVAVRAGARAAEAGVRAAEDDIIKLWIKAQSQGLKLPSEQLEKIAQETLDRFIRQSVAGGKATADDIIREALLRNPDLIDNPAAVKTLVQQVDARVSKLQTELAGDLPKIINYKFEPRTPQETPGVKQPQEAPKTSPLTVTPTAPGTVKPANPLTVEPPESPKVDIGLQPQRKPTPSDIQKFVKLLFPGETETPTETPPTTPKLPPDWNPPPITPRQPLPGENPVEVPPQFDPNRPFWRPGQPKPTTPETDPGEAPPSPGPIVPKIPIIPEEPKPSPETPKPETDPEAPPHFPGHPAEIPQPGVPETEPKPAPVIPLPGTQPSTEPGTIPSPYPVVPRPGITPREQEETETGKGGKPRGKPGTEPSPKPGERKEPGRPPQPPPAKPPVPPEPPPNKVPDIPGFPFGLGAADYAGSAVQEKGQITPIDLGLGLEAIGTFARRQYIQ